MSAVDSKDEPNPIINTEEDGADDDEEAGEAEWSDSTSTKRMRVSSRVLVAIIAIGGVCLIAVGAKVMASSMAVASSEGAGADPSANPVRLHPPTPLLSSTNLTSPSPPMSPPMPPPSPVSPPPLTPPPAAPAPPLPPPPLPTSPQPPLAPASNWTKHPLLNCWWDGHGSEEVDVTGSSVPGADTLEACQAACEREERCEGILLTREELPPFACYRKRSIVLERCDVSDEFDMYTLSVKPGAPIDAQGGSA